MIGSEDGENRATGDRLSAEEAYQFGLVSDLVDTADEVLPAARELAGRMAACGSGPTAGNCLRPEEGPPRPEGARNRDLP